MFCTRCGSFVEDGVKFCTSCGCPLENAEESMSAYNQMPSIPDAKPPHQKKRMPVGAVVAVAVAAFVLVAVGSFAAFSAMDDNDQGSSAVVTPEQHEASNVESDEGGETSAAEATDSGQDGEGAASSDAGDASEPETPGSNAESETDDFGEAYPVPGIEPKSQLNDYAWVELSAIAQAMSDCTSLDDAYAIGIAYGLCDESGNVGDQVKQMRLASGRTIDVRLVGVCVDARSDGRGPAGLTFIAAEPLDTRPMNASVTNAGGWQGSDLRSWLNGDGLALLDPDLATCIVSVTKLTNNSGQATSASAVTMTDDYLWVPSRAEILGKLSAADFDEGDGYLADIFNAEGSQYNYFRNLGLDGFSDNSALALSGSGWWLRSPRPKADSDFRYVSASGDPSWYDKANASYGVIVGFCL